MNTSKQHFWDLEGTLIDAWDTCNLVNVRRVRKYIRDNSVSEVSIFSFAIWNENDRLRFHQEIEPMLIEAFGVRIVNVPTAEEIRKVVCDAMRAQFDLTDFMCLWGKNRAFIEYCQATVPGGTVTLLDDQVPNVQHINHDLGLTLNLVNVTNLK